MSASVKKHGQWEVARFCKTCDKFLSRSVYFDHHGLCIYCGANSNILPDVNERVRRKVYTDDIGRREAIEATKSKNGIFSLFKYRMTRLLRKSRVVKRNYTWEYTEEA